jgi:hypothetical protein
MFQDTQFVFSLVVGLLFTILGAGMLAISTTGWSLMAVGVAVAAVATIFRQSALEKQPLMQPELSRDSLIKPVDMANK